MRYHARTRTGRLLYSVTRRDDSGNFYYSMLLTGELFLHREIAIRFLKETPATLLSYVDEQMNCEDILLNFFVASLNPGYSNTVGVVSRKDPVFVADLSDTCSGTTVTKLSGKQYHFLRRSRCLEYFSQVYGDVLVSTHFAIATQ